MPLVPKSEAKAHSLSKAEKIHAWLQALKTRPIMSQAMEWEYPQVNLPNERDFGIFILSRGGNEMKEERVKPPLRKIIEYMVDDLYV